MTEATNPQSQEPSRWQKLRSRRLFRWGIDLSIVALLFFAITAWQTRNLLDHEEPLPALTLSALDGSTIRLDELDARRTVVYVWATWCGVCKMQSGAIQKLHDNSGDNVDVISIVLSYTSVDAVRSHVEEAGIDYPVFLGDDRVSQAFQVSSFPTIYIVDDQSQVRHGLIGYTTGLGLRARLLL